MLGFRVLLGDAGFRVVIRTRPSASTRRFRMLQHNTRFSGVCSRTKQVAGLTTMYLIAQLIHQIGRVFHGQKALHQPGREGCFASPGPTLSRTVHIPSGDVEPPKPPRHSRRNSWMLTQPHTAGKPRLNHKVSAISARRFLMSLISSSHGAPRVQIEP